MVVGVQSYLVVMLLKLWQQQQLLLGYLSLPLSEVVGENVARERRMRNKEILQNKMPGYTEQMDGSVY